ncbi:MAG: Mut7-C RNAse domain-containing protein [Candidatus Eisenbacteria bacterium]
MNATPFVTDASLGMLARRLRQLGYDVVVHRGARLEELLEAAARDGRTVLTRSARHPKRWAAVPALHLERGELAEQLRAVTSRAVPSGPPLGRCSHCNHVLRSRSTFEAHGEVPGRVARGGSPLWNCTGCGQWFWLGTHTERLRAFFTDILGPIAGWPERPEPPTSGQMARPRP